MYFTVEFVGWCIRLHKDVLFRLTYRREWIDERNLWSDSLVSSEELAIAS
jgi:hypothetical protein